MGRGRGTGDLSDQLRAAVRGSGQTLTALAAASGVDAGRLSRFVRGERTLTLTAAAKVCTVLGLRLTGPAPDPNERG